MNSEPIKLKFKLGSQLENWEFDLSTLREYIQDEISYEVYEYIGSDKSLLGIESHKIELTFNADILEKVQYYFKKELYVALLRELEHKLGKPVVDISSTSWCLFDFKVYLQRYEEKNIVLFRY